ncbi:hypothetical protein HU200_009646 [Digitaria exilis]|uniref:Glyoxal oxidase N-terminal domain-containing protein n=1 Tax=Digitaria exilis TaxID=1010633 RepID=A0A835FLK4_9POAL|nr:hypothetical protein HU200_009646 [Digitaria exilis]
MAVAEWVVEEVPVVTVMGDMVLLPTGDVLIMNAASMGTARWVLSPEPITTQVMYTAGVMLNARCEVTALTMIPGMYHSSAALDMYGYVLVGGSNPHVGYICIRECDIPNTNELVSIA